MKLIACAISGAVLCLSVTLAVYSQNCPGSAGCLDHTFGNAGFVVASVNSYTASGWASAVAIQPDDGKIVVAVESYNVENTSAKDFYVLRFDPTSGALDPSFGSGGVVRFAFTPEADTESPRALAIQPDGKILVGGGVPNSRAGLARLNPDGSLDTSFGTGGKVTFQFVNREWAVPLAILVHADGRIAVGCNSGNLRFGFARFNANGSFDTTFNGTGKLAVEVANKNSSGGLNDMVLQPDGKYVASGSKGATKSNAQTFMLMRVNSNGTLDSTFGSSGTVVTNFGGSWSVARNVKLDNAGRIVAGGDWLTNDGQSYVFVRYLSNGQIDSTFGSAGKAIFSSPNFRRMEGMAIQPDGKIVGSGWDRDPNTTNANVAILRINSDGSLDTGFGATGFTFTDYNGMTDQGLDMAVQSDGRFVVAGVINGYRPANIGLYRYLP